MPKLVRVAVIGAGALGKEHARIYAELAADRRVEFVGVYDVSEETARRVAERTGTRRLASLEETAALADAISIVTPTVTHFDLARRFLAQGKHLLVEKPMTSDAAQAAALVELSHQHRCLLQIGHVERFNPVFDRLQQIAPHPRFIETHRLSPFTSRSTDIGVVLDLMIHDLDIVLAFVASSVVRVEGVGIPVLSKTEDIANARVTFANGCVANLTASRVSPERMRKIRVFSGGDLPVYVSLDYRAQEGYIYRLTRDDEPESSLFKKLLSARGSAIVSQFGGKKILREPVPIEKVEPLKLELTSFLRCVAAQEAPVVSAESARRALDLAFEISAQIQASNQNLPA